MQGGNILLKSSSSLEIKRYLFACLEYKWRVLFTSALIALITAFIVMQLKPTYQSTATLLIEPEQKSLVSVDEVYGFNSSKRQYYSTQFEILKSKYIAQAVVKKLDLLSHPEFKPSNSAGLLSIFSGLMGSVEPKSTLKEEEVFAKAVSKLRENLSIRPVRGTQLVYIIYQSSDRHLAAKVANAVGEVYIETQLEAKMGVTQKASQWMGAKMAELSDKLNRSEAAFEQFRQGNNIVDIESAVLRIDNELGRIQDALSTAESDKNNVDSILVLVNQLGKSDFESLKSLPEIMSYSAIAEGRQQLEVAELKFAELAKRYGSKHPKYIAAVEEIKLRDQQLNEQIKSLILGIEKEAFTANQRVTRYQAELQSTQRKYSEITKLDSKYTALKREVDTNRNLYNTFLERSKETEATSDYNLAPARFTGVADVSLYPIKPNKKLIVAAAFILSFLLLVGLIILIELLDDTVKSPADIEHKLTMRMLGMLPLVNNVKGNMRLFFDKDHKQFSEAVRTMRTGFVLSQMDRENNKVVEITSSVPGEGKTTTAINLAFSLSQIEKVLLIDADMRKPSVCKRFNIPAYHPGLSNLIAKTESIDSCVYHDEESGLSILPCGQLPPNPLELLTNEGFKEVLEQLKAKYDRIIIDTAPIQAVSDSLIISKYVDSVLYVVKGDDTHISTVKNGLGRLLQDRANLIGVVLNQVNVDKMSKTEAYHGYYDYYAYGEKAAANG